MQNPRWHYYSGVVLCCRWTGASHNYVPRCESSLLKSQGSGQCKLIDMQFNCTKEILISETAEAFQAMGYNTLIYDPRNVGESEGLPRNEISPLQQAEDLSGEYTVSEESLLIADEFCCRYLDPRIGIAERRR
jgi:hypothetical protein